MKNIVFLFPLFCVLSCQQKEKSEEPFPIQLISDNEWVVYEGTLLLGGELLNAELKLRAGSPGVDSYYQLLTFKTGEERRVKGMDIMSWAGNGAYDVLLGGSGDNRVVLLKDVKSFQFRGPNRKPFVDSYDLSFRTSGDYVLELVDDDLQTPIASSTLMRRSNLFTVEGYFTVESDTTEFFERNTREYWAVSALGKYGDAVTKYMKLAKEKHEGVYLKALGYSVVHVDASGRERDALVLKTIYQMGEDNL